MRPIAVDAGVYSGYMVNTFSRANGWNGCIAASHFVRLSALRASDGAGFDPALLVVEVALILQGSY